MNNKKRFAAQISAWLMIVMLVMSFAGCKKSGDNNTSPDNNAVVLTNGASDNKATVIGKGETKFMFIVTDKEGKDTSFEIHTDKGTVGEALTDAGLIEGEQSSYGLYVKTVNGIKADYDVDKTYWAFYIDGQYAPTGVDATKVEAGKTYSFKIEK